MKFLTLSLLITSFSAMACPNLDGLYKVCKAVNGKINKLRIMQSTSNGSSVFKIAWSDERTQIHVADGVTRTTPIFDMGFSLMSTAMCEGDVLKRTLSTLEADGHISMSITQEYSLEGDKLRFIAIDEKGVFKDILCKR